MTVEIITPDKDVFNGEATSVKLPGKNGEFQILNDHAPLVSTLAKGNLELVTAGKTQNFLVDGGVIEVSNNKVLVLAETVE